MRSHHLFPTWILNVLSHWTCSICKVAINWINYCNWNIVKSKKNKKGCAIHQVFFIMLSTQWHQDKTLETKCWPLHLLLLHLFFHCKGLQLGVKIASWSLTLKSATDNIVEAGDGHSAKKILQEVGNMFGKCPTSCYNILLIISLIDLHVQALELHGLILS